MALETKKNIIGKMVPQAVPKSQQKEKEREDKAWQRKLFGYLEGFKKSLDILNAKEQKKGGFWGFLKSIFGAIGSSLKGIMGMILGSLGLTGIFAKVSGLGIAGAALFPAAIIFWGITSAFRIIQDFMAGFKEGGLSGGIAKALGGADKGGIWNSIAQASKWGGIGALAGLATFGPIGALIGGLLGLALGAIFGWLGSEKIQKWIDKIFGLPQGELLTDAQLKQLAEDKKKMTASIANTTTELTDIRTEMEAIQAAAEARGEMYDSEKARLLVLVAAEQAAIDKRIAQRAALAQLDTKTKEHQLAVTQDAQAEVDSSLKEVGNTWTAIELEIIKMKEDMIALEKVGQLTDASRKVRLDQIASLEAQAETQKAIKSQLRDEENALEKKAQQQQLELAREKGYWTGLWVESKILLKNLWEGTYLPKWMRVPAEEWLPLWMRQPLSITLQHDLPKALGDTWKSWGTTLSNFWDGKDKDGKPLFNMPAWMTKPMGELFSDLGTSLTNFWNNKKSDGVTPLFDLPAWMTKPIGELFGDFGTSLTNFWNNKKSDGVTPLFDLPEWMTKPLGELFSDFGTSLSNFWKGKKSDGVTPLFDLPKWMTKPMGELFSDLGTSLSNWFEDLPTWADIQKSIPKWLGGTKEGTFAWSDLLTKFTDFKIKLPTWEDMKAMIPWWLGGTKGKKEDLDPTVTRHTGATITAPKPLWAQDFKFEKPQWLTDFKLPEITLPDWMTKEITFPTWEDMKAMIPAWLGGTKDGKTLSELAEETFGDWKIEFPTWDMIKKWLPDWITGPVAWIKGIFKTGDEAAVAEEQARELKKGAQSRTEERGDLTDEFMDVGSQIRQYENMRAGQDVKAQQFLDNWLKTDEGKELTSLQGLKENNPDIFLPAHQTRLDDLTAAKEKNQRLMPFGVKGDEELGLIKKRDKLEERLIFLQESSTEDARILRTDIATLVKEATSGKSLSVHDHHLEKLTKEMWTRYFLKDRFVPVKSKSEEWNRKAALLHSQTNQTGALLALAAGGPGAGGGSTVINNITNAPTTNSSSSNTNIAENTYGTVNPYVSIAGAYG